MGRTESADGDALTGEHTGPIMKSVITSVGRLTLLSEWRKNAMLLMLCSVERMSIPAGSRIVVR